MKIEVWIANIKVDIKNIRCELLNHKHSSDLDWILCISNQFLSHYFGFLLDKLILIMVGIKLSYKHDVRK